MNVIKKWLPLFIGTVFGGLILNLFIQASNTGDNKYYFMIPILILIYVLILKFSKLK